jgi:hypothetical protein
MPSVTVVVSSDTDIYISPGLYGDCLPTSATGKAADSFRAGRLSFGSFFMLAHGLRSGKRLMGIHVTSTLWPSSK